MSGPGQPPGQYPPAPGPDPRGGASGAYGQPAPAAPYQPPIEHSPPSHPGPARHTRTSAAWWAVVGGCVLLALLLVFIVQNGGESTFSFLWLDFTLPRGVALLIAAVVGAAVAALVGTIRILQLRHANRRSARSAAT